MKTYSWFVFEVDIAHRLEPERRACIQGVRARDSAEAVARALARQGDDAIHLASHSKIKRSRQQGVPDEIITFASPRQLRACSPIENAAEDTRLDTEEQRAQAASTTVEATVADPDPAIAASAAEDRT